ncbi:hypothetical protein PROFUN_14287 [Planoprotostelium fungivorum]|uniref:Uncharacterized protein n=1 Tax=Planoprotostelium fungivorum TaxID=1890364 RepID=A0A2P6N0H5_9EUKA|nr:hypothetical protein PROFUN_14287 [Planoprotostelium fungivorum]
MKKQETQSPPLPNIQCTNQFFNQVWTNFVVDCQSLFLLTHVEESLRSL